MSLAEALRRTEEALIAMADRKEALRDLLRNRLVETETWDEILEALESNAPQQNLPIRVDMGSFTLPAAVRANAYSVFHSLGTTPRLLVVWLDSGTPTGLSQGAVGGIFADLGTNFTANNSHDYLYYQVYAASDGSLSRSAASSSYIDGMFLPALSESRFLVPHYSANTMLYAGKTYRWLALSWED